VPERASPTAEDIHWSSVLLGVQLVEAFGSLDLLLSCVLEALSAQHSIHLYVFQICTIFV
jgi:hypothetical protein